MRRLRFMINSLMAFGVLFGLVLSGVANAATFDQNNIINDVVFDNPNTMTAAQIDAFLNTFPSSCISTNNGFSAVDPTGYNPTQGFLYGGYVSAGQVIYDATQAYGLNPRVILATLQKEQSLVDGSAGCSTLRYTAAVGYGCPDGGLSYSWSGVDLYAINGTPVTSVTSTCVNTSLKSGFTQQIIRATWVFKFAEQRSEGNVSWAVIKGAWDNSDDPLSNYSGYMTQGTWAIGPSSGSAYYDGNATIDGVAVHMDNGPTAALYRYTPHFPGNQSFFNIYTNWFGSTYASTTPYDWGIVSKEAYLDTNRTQAFTGGVVRIAPAQTAYLRVKVRNFGFNTWDQSVVRLGTTNPNDRNSIFANNTWLNTGRLQMVESSVPPGGTATFVFSVTAPQTVGNYYETFDMLAEGITWMPDQNLGYYIDVNNPVQPQTTQYMLRSGESLTPGANLLSQDTQSALELSKNGNITLYSNFVPYWSTNTLSIMPKELIMQGDGNLVLYDNNGGVLWASGTDGNSGATCILQTDGNLVIYSLGGVALWSTSTILIPGGLSYVNARTSTTAHLLMNQQLQTANKLFRLVMQGDGNLVLYNQNNLPVWATGTDKNPGAFFDLQADGNMVIYNKDSKPIWSSGTYSNLVSHLVMQTDGNLVLYNSSYHAIWQSNTVQMGLAANSTNSLIGPQQLGVGQSIISDNQQYVTILQSDGNLVTYNVNGKAMWSSQTNGKPVTVAVLQSDGNFVLYGSAGQVYWATGTDGKGISSSLIMQNDGSLLLYSGIGKLIWAANTNNSP